MSSRSHPIRQLTGIALAAGPIALLVLIVFAARQGIKEAFLAVAGSVVDGVSDNVEVVAIVSAIVLVAVWAIIIGRCVWEARQNDRA